MKNQHNILVLLGVIVALGRFAAPAQASQTMAAGVVQSDSTATELVRQGQEQAKRGNHQAAILSYAHALQIDPSYAPAYIYQGISYHDIGDYNQALTSFQEAVQTDPNNAKAYYNLGETQTHFRSLTKISCVTSLFSSE